MLHAPFFFSPCISRSLLNAVFHTDQFATFLDLLDNDSSDFASVSDMRTAYKVKKNVQRAVQTSFHLNKLRKTGKHVPQGHPSKSPMVTTRVGFTFVLEEFSTTARIGSASLCCACAFLSVFSSDCACVRSSTVGDLPDAESDEVDEDDDEEAVAAASGLVGPAAIFALNSRVAPVSSSSTDCSWACTACDSNGTSSRSIATADRNIPVGDYGTKD